MRGCKIGTRPNIYIFLITIFDCLLPSHTLKFATLPMFAGLATVGAAHEPGGPVCPGRGSGPDQCGAQVRGRHQEDQHRGRAQAGR